MELFRGVNRISSMRNPRIHFPGALFHVMARGNEGREIFRDDADRRFFLAKLLDLRDRSGFLIHAYCLMSNHFHLLLEMADISLTNVMHRLLLSYAKRFNWRHERSGHLFQDRYKSILCPRDSYFIELIRYIHLNPVRAGIVERAEKWAWSGHNELLTGKYNLLQGVFVEGLFAKESTAARAAYREFVDSAIGQPVDELLFDEIEPRTEIDHNVRTTQILHSLGKVCVMDLPVSRIEVLRGSKRKDVVAARQQLILWAVDRGISREEIARYLRCSESAISRSLTRSGR